ncbi:MAG: DNA polymerase III subunit delta [Clostridiales bacterium]|nr:DNA polymerase III subunit delta [Clostridiales bacterium]
MAQKNDSFLQLKQQIKNKQIGNLYLFFGEEVFIKDMYLEHMQNLVPDGGFGDFNRIFLEGRDISSDKVDDALDSFPMMAEKKIIIIKNSGIFKSASEDTKELWLERLKNIPDFVLLIFDERDVDKRSALYKAVSKYGSAVEFGYMKDYEVSAWVVREANKLGKKISKECAELLVSMCDPGIQNVKNELDKLCNYCDSEIYKTDIEKVVSKPLGIVVFEITDAIMEKKSDKAMSVILRLKDNRESAFNILYLLSAAFDKMLFCRLMLDENATYDMISSRLKLPPFITRKYIDGAKGFSKEFLIGRICKTAEYDLAVKQGEIDEWTALLQYLFECFK